MDATEKRIVEIIESRRDEILAFANDIYDHAELGYKEFRTAEKFREKLAPVTDRLEEELAITGIKAHINEDKRENFSLALLGELDALRIPGHPHYNADSQGAHCCGHHAQLTGVVGASMALCAPEIREKLDGQLIFFAVPAEEYGEVEFKKTLMDAGRIQYGGGKCELLRIGAFDDIDSCVAHHTSPTGTGFGNGTGNGFVSKVIRIKGRASHAAAAPDKGVNALSAASIGLSALAYNRETFRDEDCVRVHPIMTKGGDLVNVVPDEAILETLVRGKTLEAFADASEKTDRSFKAGAMAMGAGYSIETMPGYLPQLAQEYPEEIVELIEELTGKSLCRHDLTSHSGGSTDVGDVQHLMPVYSFTTGGVTGGLHQTDFTVVDEDEAYMLTAKIFALTAYRLLRDGASLAKKLKAGYTPRFTSREEYVAFMDAFNRTEER